MNKYIIYFLVLIPIENSSFFNIRQLQGCQAKTFRNARPFFLTRIDFSYSCKRFQKCLKKSYKNKNKCIRYFILQMKNSCSKLTPLKKIFCNRLAAKNQKIIYSQSKFLKKSYSRKSSSSSSSSSSKKYSSSSTKNQCKKENFYIKLLKKKLKNISTEACERGEICAKNDKICQEDETGADDSKICNGEKICQDTSLFCPSPKICSDSPGNGNSDPDCDAGETCTPVSDICDPDEEKTCVDKDMDVCEENKTCMNPNPCDGDKMCLDPNKQCNDPNECINNTFGDCANEVRIFFDQGDFCLKNDNLQEDGNDECRNDNSLWVFEKLNNGFYKIISNNGTDCLQAPSSEGNAIIDSCISMEDAQEFTISRLNDNLQIISRNNLILSLANAPATFEDSPNPGQTKNTELLLLNTCYEGITN